MKVFARRLLSGLIAICFVASAFAQGDTRGTSKLDLKGRSISVEYQRPSLNGRTIDELLDKVPPGGIWRVATGTSATFRSEIDLTFADAYPASAQRFSTSVVIPAGEYSIWMQRQADHSWKLLFYKQHGGSPDITPEASECFASVPLLVSGPHDGIPLETLKIELAPTHEKDYGGWIMIQWGTLEARAFFAPK